MPGKEKPCVLYIPYRYTNAFIDHEAEIYAWKADKYFSPVALKKIKDGMDGTRIIYTVRSGDVLGKIAMKHHVSIAQIKRWNGLKSDFLRTGQKLVIYPR